MKKKLGTVLVALATVLAFTACDGIARECEECPTCPEVGEGEGETHKEYKINLETNEYIYVFDLPEEADKDEEVSFRVLTESGYYASNVSVTYKGTELREVVPEEPEEPLEEESSEESSEDESLDDSEEEKEPEYEEVEVDIEVELTGSASTGYSFIMPDKDVTVHAEGLGAYFKLWYDTDEVAFVSYNNNNRKVGDFINNIREPITGESIATGSSIYVQAGKEILVVAKRTYTETDIVLCANGEPLELVTDEEINAGLFAFDLTMPAEDVKLTATADYHYMNVSIDTSDLVDEDGNPIVDAYLYTEGDETPVQQLTGQKVAEDKPYIHAKVNETYAEDWGIDSVTISWNAYGQSDVAISEKSKTTTWSNTTTSTGTDGTAARVDDNTKKFQIPSAYYSDDEIVVTFTLKDLQAFKGAAFLGSWRGFEFYNGSIWSSFSNVSMSIAGDGTITSTATYIANTYVDAIAEDGTSAVLHDGRTFYNDGKVGIMGYQYQSTGVSTSDVWVMAKTDGDAAPTFDLWKESNNVWCLRLFVDNEYVGAVFANNTLDQKIYAGVTITWNDSGDSFATSSNFTITAADGTTLANVSEEPAG